MSEAVGFVGGIWVLWNSDYVTLELVAGDAQVMTVFVQKVAAAPWMFSAVYASPNWWYREELWDYLIRVGAIMTLPWLVLGDFNQVLYASDKKGGRPVSSSRTRSLAHMVGTCGLVDFGFTSSKYTWSNMRSGLANVQEWLDRVFGNALSVHHLSSYRVVHLPRTRSDHHPLLLQTVSDSRSRQISRPFKVHAACFKHPTFELFVIDCWTEMEGRLLLPTMDFLRCSLQQ